MNGALPLGYMSGAGSRSAQTLEQIAWGFSAISVAVVVLIALLIGLAIARARKPGDDGVVPRDGQGLKLIWWGVGLSLPVLRCGTSLRPARSRRSRRARDRPSRSPAIAGGGKFATMIAQGCR